MGMSNFNEKDVAQIKKWGNHAAKKHWMSNYNKTLYPVPERRDLNKMKEFMKLKYVQKRFMEGDDESDSSSEEDSSDDDKKKKKKHKKTKKTKKSKKKKKKVTSSEEDSDDDSESEEEAKEKPKEKVKGGHGKKLGSAGIQGGKLGKPKAPVKSTPTTKAPVKETKADNAGILDLDFDSAPPPEQPQNDNGDNGWADFAFGSPAEQKPQESSSNNNNNWGDVFDTKTQNEKRTSDLLGNLGNLYGQAQQQQQQNMNPFGQFGQPNAGAGGQQNFGNFGFGSPTGTQPQAPPTQMNVNSDDPFANAMQEQQKQQFQNVQNTAQQNASSPGAQNTGVTPNMFFQQMMSMMGNQGGNANPQQNAMMMAAMQNMMKQMSLNNQQPQQQQQEPEPEPSPVVQKPDPSKGAFKNLFNDAKTSSMGTGGTRFSNASSNTAQSHNSGFDAFGASATQSQPRNSEPANPFGGFGSEQPQTTNSNDLFGTQFGNSGWGGGNSGTTQQNTQPSSSNPFDMFK
jgi:hypothetical protein